MKVYRFLPILVVVFAVSLFSLTPHVLAQAYEGEAFGEVTQEQICFNVVNTAPYRVYGGIETNDLIRPDGIKTKHREIFRLGPEEQVQFCTTGPFYDNREIRVILRSLVPMFECKTSVMGDIVIQGVRLPEGGTRSWIECTGTVYLGKGVIRDKPSGNEE